MLQFGCVFGVARMLAPRGVNRDVEVPACATLLFWYKMSEHDGDDEG